MKEEILVSISCITYNHERYIAEAIESFLMQITDFKYEILIHDDASTDNTAKIIKNYEEKYPEIIKVIYQKENQYSQGKKVGLINIERAKGKYIAVCEGDDYWTDRYKLQKQIDYMEKNPECGLCFHTVSIFDDKTKKIIKEIKPYKENTISPPEDVILGDGGFMGTNSIIYRKENMQEIPKFYLLSPVGDYPLQILHSTLKYAYFLKDNMSIYRINTGTSWTDNSKSKDKKLKVLIGTVNMLEEFNKYSNGKYKNAVDTIVSDMSYKIIKYNIEAKVLNKKEYKKYYKNIKNLKRKMKIFRKKLKNFLFK